jgi:hypothetical protein
MSNMGIGVVQGGSSPLKIKAEVKRGLSKIFLKFNIEF